MVTGKKADNLKEATLMNNHFTNKKKSRHTIGEVNKHIFLSLKPLHGGTALASGRATLGVFLSFVRVYVYSGMRGSGCFLKME